MQPVRKAIQPARKNKRRSRGILLCVGIGVRITVEVRVVGPRRQEREGRWRECLRR